MNGFFGFANRDEKNKKDIKNMTLTVKKNRCPQNHNCPAVGVCPANALSQKGFEAPAVDMKNALNAGNA